MSAARRPARRLRPPRDPVPRLGAAVDAFLGQPDLASSSRRSYAQTLGRLRDALGADRPLDRLGARELERAAREAWGALAPATWNRHLATLRSFSSYCRRRGWLDAAIADGLERRREPVDRTRAIPYAQLERLWRRDDVAVREKALWRLLYETAARAQEALSLNVEDVDLDNKRARVRSKGGDIEWLHLQAGSARLLPRLIAGRPLGPLFLADRRPAPARMPAAVDLCPSTGRARLSYRRAEELFCAASGGWTLHQLRHSALTHLAEADVSLPLLMAKSRHVSLRSLQRYARPGTEAVAKLAAEHDPERRRR
jgi:integrase